MSLPSKITIHAHNSIEIGVITLYVPALKDNNTLCHAHNSIEIGVITLYVPALKDNNSCTQ